MTRTSQPVDPMPAVFDRLKAEDVMQREVQVAHAHTKADVIASLMIEGFGGVPIVNERHHLIGIVTEFDLLGALDAGQSLPALEAKSVMTKDVLSVRDHTDVRTLIYVLQTNHLIRVPVVDQEGKVVGIAARRDVLQAYLGTREE